MEIQEAAASWTVFGDFLQKQKVTPSGERVLPSKPLVIIPPPIVIKVTPRSTLSALTFELFWKKGD